MNDMKEISGFTLIQGGLIWACSIAWADTIRSGAEYIYPNDNKKKMEAQLIYSVILTIIVVFTFQFLQTIKDEIKEIQKYMETKK